MCNCIDEVDAFLADRNARIMMPIIGPQRPFVETMKVDPAKRGRIPSMFASFCPFCGEKYPPSKSETA
jgi:hypothetical protein